MQDIFTAEALYGTKLEFPAQYFLKAPLKEVNMTSFIDGPSNKMSEMAYSPAEQNKRDKTYVPKLLKTCLSHSGANTSV